ncbi:ATP-binding protein [Marinifilum sp. RC60d5]|uniref:ATP-binding protein n=1 Tax=Marinifilum sp. RC60d5 TaxID=3458414 RepID=UPI004035771E
MRKIHFITLLFIWILLISISFLWNYSNVKVNNEKVVLNKSQSFFNQILISRSWNASHGGVYVPIDEKTQPNEYLKDSAKNITTLNGMQLTKVNPSFMTRQIAEHNDRRNNVHFHITSLNCIRPKNKPTEKEIQALKRFEAGENEVLNFVEFPEPSYMYMAPLHAEQSCLQCHGFQGYKAGDVRGGISVSFPAKVYIEAMRSQIISLSVVHFILLFLGILGIVLFYKINNKYFAIIGDKNLELQQTISGRDKLFAIIAHDLRSPFSAILGYLDILHQDYKELSEEEISDCINEADKAAHDSFDLLNNLLIWAKSQQDGIVIDIKKVNLCQIIKEALLPHLNNANIKDITVKIEVSEEIFICVDEFTFQSIISNIITNALKFTPRGGTISISAIEENELVKITISDTGVGIPSNKIKKIFNEDVLVTTKGTDGEAGSGLGLMLCKELSEKNKGKISIESTLGKGTNVILKFPNCNTNL